MLLTNIIHRILINSYIPQILNSRCCAYYRQHGAAQGARPREHHVPHPDGVRGVHAAAVAHVPAAAGLRVPALPHEGARRARDERGRGGRGGLQAARRPRARAAAAGARRARPAPLGGAPGAPRAALRVPRRHLQPRPHQAVAQVRTRVHPAINYYIH